jgi:hypothetical protein
MPVLRDRGKRQGSGGAKVRTKKKKTRAAIVRTCPGRRGGGGRQASKEEADGEHRDYGRMSHQAIPGPQLRAGEGKFFLGFLCSETSWPAEFVSLVWWGSNGNPERGAQVLRLPSHGHVPGGHAAGIGRSDHETRRSTAAPCMWGPFAATQKLGACSVWRRAGFR